MSLTRRIRLLRWLTLLWRRPSRPKCLVHLEWGEDDLEHEMIALDFIPRVGDDIEIKTRNVADDPKRWLLDPVTKVGKVVRVQHSLQIDYGNDPGPNSFQSVTVKVLIHG